MKTTTRIRLYGLLAVLLCWLVPHTGAAQAPKRPATKPAVRSTANAPAGIPDAPSDDHSFRKEVVFGINFNTQGGLIGGVSFRSARVLEDRWLRFWSLEGVSFKNPKEQRYTNIGTGGSFVDKKSNYALSLRPSFGIQRILFRKAPDAGVQVNALLSAGPSIGILMPYYISYDYTYASSSTNQYYASDDIRDEQYDPQKHTKEDAIVDSAPLFSGISETKFVPGAHLRGALSFEFGRYRDAVAGAEVGFILDAYTKRLIILNPGTQHEVQSLNKSFLPAVYLTLYLGHRS